MKSFFDAFRGIGILVRKGFNFRIHIIVMTVVIAAGIVLKIPASDWLAIIIVSGLVLAAEAFNTATEYLCDKVSPEFNNAIRDIKDVSAAGVLISAIIAVITGLIIFLPELISIFRRLP